MKLETLTASPITIVERIEHFVQLRTNGMVRDLNVDVVDGEIILTGRTSTVRSRSDRGQIFVKSGTISQK